MSHCPDYPNLEAMASGTISGRFSEWPRVRPEAKAALAELRRLRGVEAELVELRARITHHPATCHICNPLRVEDVLDGLPRLSSEGEALKAMGAGQPLVKMREIR